MYGVHAPGACRRNDSETRAPRGASNVISSKSPGKRTSPRTVSPGAAWTRWGTPPAAGAAAAATTAAAAIRAKAERMRGAFTVPEAYPPRGPRVTLPA